jgi:hypothetical protein
VIDHEIPTLSGEDANDFALRVLTGKDMCQVTQTNNPDIRPKLA